MQEQLEYSVEIHRVKSSKIDSCDFSKLKFGEVFSDHMLAADYKEGRWDASIVPYAPISLSPGVAVFHYAQSVFEGMKAFSKKSSSKKILFRPVENAHRLNRSLERMCMPKIPEGFFMDSLKSLIDLDRQWIPSTDKGSLYVRPVVFAMDEKLGVVPSSQYKFLIITSPSGNYYSKPVRLKVERTFTRAASGGVGFAKAAGNYAASLYATEIAKKQNFDQVIWTDSKDHQYIEEAGTMNLMFIINDTLITPQTDDTILEGVTRKSVLALAKEWGVKIEVRKIHVDEILDALKTKKLQEAFGVGTAAVVTHVDIIGDENQIFKLPPIETRDFSLRVLKEINGLTCGEIQDKRGWIVEV